MITIDTVMQGVLDAVYARLSNKPTRASLQPGSEVAWDDCDCGGSLWVQLTGYAPKTAANLSRSAQPFCDVVGWQATLAVGRVQCVAVMTDSGKAPPAAQVSSDALKVVTDMREMLTAILCDVPELSGVKRVKLGSWSPLGPLGGCAGGQWTLTVELGHCSPCEAG